MRLLLTNFRHHRSLTLDLPNSGVILLSGSSGTGKSTILASLEYLLYGKLRKVSSFESNKTRVQLEYDGVACQKLVDEAGEPATSLTIFRSREPRMLELRCGDTVYQHDDAQDVINRLFGNEDVFLASSFLRQGERSLLLDGRNVDKLSLVEQFAFSDDHITEHKQQVETEVRKANQALEMSNNQVKMLEHQVDKYKVQYQRPLSLYEDELKGRQKASKTRSENSEPTAESLDLELAEISRDLDATWREQNDLEVQNRVRDSIVERNTSLQTQIADIQLPSDFDLQQIQNKEEALGRVKIELERGKLLAEYSQLYEESEVKRRKMGSPPPEMETLALGSADELLVERTQLQEQSRQLKKAQEHNKALQVEISSLPSLSETVDELLEELETTKRVVEYQQLIQEQDKQRQVFEAQHGSQPPELSDQKRMSDVELRDKQRHLLDLESQIKNNKELERQLSLLQEPIQDPKDLEESLTVARLQESLSCLKDVKALPTPTTEFPLKLDELTEIRFNLVRLLDDYQGVKDSYQTNEISELEGLMKKLKLDLENCGSHVVCPECRADLIFSNGELRSETVKKTKPLPARIGSKISQPIVKPVERKPLCLESPAVIQSKINGLERALDLVSDFTQDHLESQLEEIDMVIDWVRQRDALAPKLAKKEDLLVELGDRSVKETVAELEQRIKDARIWVSLESSLSEVDLKEYEDLVEECRIQGQLRDQQLRLREFEFQREREDSYAKKRLALLRLIFPDIVKEDLETMELPEVRDLRVITEEVKLAKKLRSLKSQLLPEPVVDVQRLEEVMKTLDSYNQNRQARQIYQDYRRQAEMDKQLRYRLLRQLFPGETEEDLAELDTGCQKGVEISDLENQLKSLEREIKVLRQYQTQQQKLIMLRSQLQSIPLSVSDKLLEVKQKIKTLSQRKADLSELRSHMTTFLQLNRLTTDLEQAKNQERDNAKQSALLQKMYKKVIETETQLLEATIATINLQMAQQLEHLFDTPISVRFETTKTYKSGSQKYCINLSVQHRGVVYDDISQLSGGEAGRISLAVTLALNHVAGSHMLLLDETLANLDGELIDSVVDALKDTSLQYSIPIFVVLHNSCCGYYDHVVNL